MKEFWDNSQEHKDDIANFLYGGKQYYFSGTCQYWIGFINMVPYSFLLSDILQPSQQDLSDLHRQHLSCSGHTISLDFGIGNKDYLGKGLAAPTLTAFVKFYHETVDPKADTFFIDPNEDNSRAQHVYEKAGFKRVGKFLFQEGAFKDSTCCLMVTKVPLA